MKDQTQSGTFVLRAPDFYKMLEDQEYRCAITGRELTPEVTDCEHIIPLRRGGRHELKNIYLVHRDVSKLKRYMTEDEMVFLAQDIIQWKGADFGILIEPVKNSRRKKQ